ncbi:MAG: type II toxin-antitoxin system RelE/ParE family toxin [Sterolibacterium sp.]|nr:type II toxin-antitoxin system RelE/ParE family toxin [Sterolibacterium sp.]
MAHKLRWTRRALARLDDIAAFIARDNPVRAASFVCELRDKLGVLREQQIGRPGRVYGTRELVLHKHYIAVYRVQGDEVQVLTVLHTAQKRL